jgi:HSP20 family protein
MAEQSKVPAQQENKAMSNPLEALHQRIDRIFNEFGSGFGFPKSFWDEGMRMPSVWGDAGVMPSLELHDTDGKVTVTAELPGVDEKDINVSVDDQMLTISGEKKSEVEHKDGDRYRSERSYGKFSRSVSLPFAIDPGKVDARFDKGVLTLKIEKPAEAVHKAKKIEIRH